MQRTRSSPSALRSPLMRCPLGDVWVEMRAPIAAFRTGAFVFGVGEIVVMVEPEGLGVGRASADDEKSLFGSRAIREGGRWAVLLPAVLAESVA
jgi:hypothetical protein